MIKDRDFERFCNALGTLAEIHDKNLSKFAIAAYFETLRGYSIEKVESAISRAIGTEEWFPKPIKLIEIITGGGAQNIEDRAELEAHKVVEAVRRIGGYKSVKFEDPVTMAVVAQGFNGWSNLCNDLTENQVKWFVRDFVKIYAAYKRQGIEHAGHLPGKTEIENTANGFDYDTPVMIGDSRKLKQLPN